MAELFIRDQERVQGPCSPVRIKHLAAAGQIMPNWSIGKSKEGPWVSAGSIRGLFPPADAGGPAMLPSRMTDANRPAGFTTVHWSVIVTAAVLPWLIAGLLSVLLPGLRAGQRVGQLTGPAVARSWGNRPVAVRMEEAAPTARFLDDLPDAIDRSRRGGKDLLVVFVADWCGPCRRLKRDLAGAESFCRDVLVCVVDCDKQRALCDLHGVRGIPDLRLYRKGEEVKRMTGYGGSIKDLATWVQVR